MHKCVFSILVACVMSKNIPSHFPRYFPCVSDACNMMEFAGIEHWAYNPGKKTTTILQPSQFNCRYRNAPRPVILVARCICSRFVDTFATLDSRHTIFTAFAVIFTRFNSFICGSSFTHAIISKCFHSILVLWEWNEIRAFVANKRRRVIILQVFWFPLWVCVCVCANANAMKRMKERLNERCSYTRKTNFIWFCPIKFLFTFATHFIAMRGGNGFGRVSPAF